MAFGRGNAVGRFPLFGALEVRGDLRLELVVANLRRQQDGWAAPSVAAQIERQPLAANERALIVDAMRLDVAGGRNGKLAVFQTNGCTVGVEVDDDAADEFQGLRACRRRRAYEDNRFVRPDEA